MDEFARDLSHALDEFSDIRIHDSKLRRSKTGKCRLKSKSGMIYGNNVLQYCTRCEDSESSLDTTPQDINFLRKVYRRHTACNDIMHKIKQQNYRLTSWRPCSINWAKSDSPSQNLYRSRQPRRKRKFKRMNVYPPSVTKQKFPIVCNTPLFTQKNKRLHYLRSQKISNMNPKLSELSVSRLSAEMQNVCKNFGNTSAATGKRKRWAQKNGCNCKDFISSRSGFSSSCHCPRLDRMHTIRKHEISSSALSSSESECGVLTNDESREADDEQSDFFQESGPIYGTPNCSPWSKDDVLPDEQKIFDPDLQNRLSETFQRMSEAAEKIYTIQVNIYNKAQQQMQSSERHSGKLLNLNLKQKMINPDDLLSDMSVTEKFDCSVVAVDNCYTTKTTPNEKKKRRPPLSNSTQADDEQSDFFQESDPKCCISNFSPRLKDDDVLPDEQKILNPDLQNKLSESFRCMSEAAQKMYTNKAKIYKV